MSLELPRAIPPYVAQHVEEWGRRRNCESGLLLLGGAKGMLADTIAWPGTRGIVRKRQRFAISGLALAQIFDWATERELAVHALVHSHGGRAALSLVDLDHGFSVPGLISAIVPHYREPSAEVNQWGWWQFEGDEWTDIEPPKLVDARFGEVTFDESGVR